MDTNREDVSIAIRSAFLSRGTQQRFSLFVLIIISLFLIFLETIQTKPLNKVRSVLKDLVYRSATIVSYPTKGFTTTYETIQNHINLYKNFKILDQENKELKSNLSKSCYLELENAQLREIIDLKVNVSSNLITSKVILDKQSPYLNSFVISVGSNKKIKKGMAVLDGKNFIGRIVDVNFFSSRVLLVTDLNSKIPVILEPSGLHAILSGRGTKKPTLQYLPDKHNIQGGDKIYTSGKEGIFEPGITIGKTEIKENIVNAILNSSLKQITYVNVDLGKD